MMVEVCLLVFLPRELSLRGDECWIESQKPAGLFERFCLCSEVDCSVVGFRY